MIVAIAESEQLSETAPVVNNGLVKGDIVEDDLWIWVELLFAGSILT